MAQQSSPATRTETEDRLSFTEAAFMSFEGSGPPTDFHDFSVGPVPHDYTNQLLSQSMMPIPSPNATTTLPYHGAQQNGELTVQSDVTFFQSDQTPPQDGNHDEPEVEMSCASEKQDDVSQAVEPMDIGAKSTETQRDISSEDSPDEDMSDGAESRTTLQSDGDLDRVDNYTFNSAGQAYEHRVPQHLAGGTTIFAKKVTATITLLQHLESVEDQEEDDVTPTLVPHEQDMKRKIRKVECVWVGMLPNPHSNPKHSASIAATEEPQDGASPASKRGTTKAQVDGASNTAKKLQKRSKKTQCIIDIEDDQLDVIPYSPNALRVVAKKQTRAVKTWHLYALTTSDDDSKLCQGWKVHVEDVFFFKPFRNDTVAGHLKRRHASEHKIKAVTFPAEATPAPVPQPAASVQEPASLASVPGTPTPADLPTPKSSCRTEKATHNLHDDTRSPDFKDEEVADQGDVHTESLGGRVEDANAPDEVSQLAADVEPGDMDAAQSAMNQRKTIALVYDDGDEDAYPEHAVSASNESYKKFLDHIVHELSTVEAVEPVGPFGIVAGSSSGEKRKRVAFEPGCEDAANTRRKTGGSFRSNEDGQGGLQREGSASFVVRQQTDHLVGKIMKTIGKLAEREDMAGLRQCATMMECIERRGCLGPKSALAPYLNVTSKKDANHRACNGKLREILDLFPNLEDVDVDSHVLTCMIAGLRLTGQSIDIGLIEPCIKSFSRLYKEKFGETSNHPAKMNQADLLDMVCRARDDAEKMVKKIPLNTESKVWAPHFWVDPRRR